MPSLHPFTFLMFSSLVTYCCHSCYCTLLFLCLYIGCKTLISVIMLLLVFLKFGYIKKFLQILLGLAALAPHLWIKRKFVYIFTYWGERSEPHTCGVNEKLSVYIYIYLFIYIYIWYVRIPYIYILPHLCAMQYFHIACWLI